MLEYGKSQTCFVSALGPETLTYSEKVMPTNGRSLFNAIVRGTERGPAAAFMLPLRFRLGSKGKFGQHIIQRVTQKDCVHIH